MKLKILSFLLLFSITPLAFSANLTVAQKTPQAKTVAAKKPQIVPKQPQKNNDKKLITKKQAPKVEKISVIKKNTPVVKIIPIANKQTPAKKIIPMVEKKKITQPKAQPKNLQTKNGKKQLKSSVEVSVKKQETAQPTEQQKKAYSFKISSPPPCATPTAMENTDLRKIAKEASLDLESEQDVTLGDLRILWQYAVENSETIKFAIYKLSDPKGDLKKADESKIKKLLKPIAGITPFLAATAPNPLAVGSSMVGSNFMNDLFAEEKYKKHFEKVTDADLVILAKSLDDLQGKLVSTYYEYKTAQKVLNYADKNLQNRKQLCDSLDKTAPDEAVVIADTFYREALAKQNQAQSNLLLKRAALEQLVGNNAILLIENNKKENLQNKNK